jgi:hypothetical protein
VNLRFLGPCYPMSQQMWQIQRFIFPAAVR